MNYIVLGAILIQTLFNFIGIFFSFNACNLCSAIVNICLSLSVGVAPFGWIPYLDDLFKVSSVEIWRPIVIIALSAWFIPGNFDNVTWYNWPCFICGLVNLLIGLVFLITDILVKCNCISCESSNAPKGSSGSSSKASVKPAANQVVTN